MQTYCVAFFANINARIFKNSYNSKSDIFKIAHDFKLLNIEYCGVKHDSIPSEDNILAATVQVEAMTLVPCRPEIDFSAAIHPYKTCDCSRLL